MTEYVCIICIIIALSALAKAQTVAASFSAVLCTSVNVTFPNFLGCTNGSSLVTLETSEVVIRTPTSSATVAGTVESQLSLITTAAMATFTGEKLLTGSCSLPQFASMTLPTGGVLEYPWLGCSVEDPGCCPFVIEKGGKLSVRPADYVSTSSACCPS